MTSSINDLPNCALKIKSTDTFKEQKVKISSANPELRYVAELDEIDKNAELGLPLGGIGTGGIVWGRKGKFNRWSIKPGYFNQFEETGCGFAIRTESKKTGNIEAKALQSAPKDNNKQKTWEWQSEAQTPDYTALFPKSIREYSQDSNGISLKCEAFSPVIENDIDTSSTPVAIFNWELTNNTNEDADISLMFHWVNMCNWFNDANLGQANRSSAGCINSSFTDSDIKGVVFSKQSFEERATSNSAQWAIATQQHDDSHVSICETTNAIGDSDKLWRAFSETGNIEGIQEGWQGDSGFRTHESNLMLGAVCQQVTAPANSTIMLSFSLSWDLPIVKFGLGEERLRWHTKKWGESGNNAEALAKNALVQKGLYSNLINKWHEKLSNQIGDKPEEAGFSINELYFVVDGATVLLRENDKHANNFALLECPAYPFYNTLDLWVYAGDALLRNWPELAKMVMEEYSHSVSHHDPMNRKLLNNDTIIPLKRRASLPHDHGAPEEAPFSIHNSYTLQDSTEWKDLNCQYILDVWRGSQYFGDEWLKEQYEDVCLAMKKLESYDTDHDGLIENSGFPDQTFDNIPMKGASSYCSGLWLATLAATSEMAKKFNDTGRLELWSSLLEKGKMSFDRLLWNGDYYRVDTDGPMSDCLFLEQLFGPFLAKKYGLGDLIPEDKAKIALKTLYVENFQKAGMGKGPRLLIGATSDGLAEAAKHGDPDAQITEVITGIAMSFAAQLRCWGLVEEADMVRNALYKELYVERGYFFKTPAAFEIERPYYRAPLNLRPLAIWLDK